MYGSHLGAMLVVMVLAVPIGLRVALAVALAGSLWVQRARLAAAAGTLRIDRDGTCVLTRAAAGMRGRVAGGAVFPLFTRLSVASGARRARILLVMRDAVTPEEYRALRAAIVQRRLPAPAVQPPP